MMILLLFYLPSFVLYDAQRAMDVDASSAVFMLLKKSSK